MTTSEVFTTAQHNMTLDIFLAVGNFHTLWESLSQANRKRLLCSENLESRILEFSYARGRKHMFNEDVYLYRAFHIF